MSFGTQTSYTPETGDIEPFVRQLCTDLKDIETVMVGALWTDKCRYLFDGLGHFIYTILLKSAFAISQINKKGVNKMCVLGCEPYNVHTQTKKRLKLLNYEMLWTSIQVEVVRYPIL